jgi:hypothetical protein
MESVVPLVSARGQGGHNRQEERMRQKPFTVVRGMKKSVLTALVVLTGVAAWPAAAEASTVATWPLAANANDTTGNHNGMADNIDFSTGSAFFDGVDSRIKVPYSTALSPGAAPSPLPSRSRQPPCPAQGRTTST